MNTLKAIFPFGWLFSVVLAYNWFADQPPLTESTSLEPLPIAARTEPPLPFSGGVSAPPSPGLVVDAVVVEVYDGDTITVRPLLPSMRVRLLDCWAPEIRTRNAAEKVRGYKSRDHLRELLPNDCRVRLHVPTTDKLEDSLTLGRVLGRIWRDVDQDGELDDVSRLQVVGGFATETKGE